MVASFIRVGLFLLAGRLPDTKTPHGVLPLTGSSLLIRSAQQARQPRP